MSDRALVWAAGALMVMYVVMMVLAIRLSGLAVSPLNIVSTVALLFATAFSYLHQEYGTAVVCGVSAGVVGGITAAQAMMRSQR